MFVPSRHVAFGKGPRSLVVIPGLSLNDVTVAPDVLKPVFKPFFQGWTVYVIDRPADVPAGTTNYDLAVFYARMMEYLGIESADIIGTSQGGMIGQHLAVSFPDKVHRLVLAATLARPNPTMERVFAHWIELAEDEKWEELNLDFFGRLFSDAYLEKYSKAFAMLVRTQKSENKERFINMVRACLTAGPFEDLGKIACPVLVVGGDLDGVLTGEASREIAAVLGCELHMYSSLRHAVYDEASEDFYRRTLEFLSK